MPLQWWRALSALKLHTSTSSLYGIMPKCEEPQSRGAVARAKRREKTKQLHTRTKLLRTVV